MLVHTSADTASPRVRFRHAAVFRYECRAFVWPRSACTLTHIPTFDGQKDRQTDGQGVLLLKQKMRDSHQCNLPTTKNTHNPKLFCAKRESILTQPASQLISSDGLMPKHWLWWANLKFACHLNPANLSMLYSSVRMSASMCRRKVSPWHAQFACYTHAHVHLIQCCVFCVALSICAISCC